MSLCVYDGQIGRCHVCHVCLVMAPGDERWTLSVSTQWMFRVMMISVIIMMMMLDAVSEQLIAIPAQPELYWSWLRRQLRAELTLSHSASDPAPAPGESWGSGSWAGKAVSCWDLASAALSLHNICSIADQTQPMWVWKNARGSNNIIWVVSICKFHLPEILMSSCHVRVDFVSPAWGHLKG